MSSPRDEYALKYFRDAATLRLCLEYNEEDYSFAKAGGRINYIFDANIVRFFIDPSNESYNIVAFKGSDNRDYAEATALITAEFLFSRTLAGQGRSPALITPTHGEEIERIAAKILEAPIEVAPDLSRLAREKLTELRHLTDALQAGKISRTEAVKGLREAVPELARLLIDSNWSMAGQLLRLYDEDRIRPLGLHPRATKAILQPDSPRVNAWVDRLKTEQTTANKQRAAHSPSDQKRTVDVRRAKHDAEALVQAMMLDEDAAQETDRAPLRYVMVTADNILFDAYARWYWSAPRSAHERFILRLPLQYVPVLNAFEMPNGIDSMALTHQAKAALDSLFTNLNRVDADYARKLSYYRTMTDADSSVTESLRLLYGENPLSLNQQGLERVGEIRRAWHQCFKTGVILNTNLLNQRRQEFEFLAERLRDDVDLRQEVFESHSRNLDRIAVAHALFSTQIQIIAERAEQTSEPNCSDAPPLLTSIVLNRLLGPTPVREALRRLSDLGAALLQKLADSANAEMLFLAACIALQLGRGRAAALYAERALDQAGGETLSEEAAVVLASALRVAFSQTPPSPSDQEGILKALSHGARAVRLFNERGDELGEARALCELQGLELCLSGWRAVLPATSIEAALPSAAAAFYIFQRVLSLCEGVAAEADRDLLRDIRRRLNQNLLAIAAFAALDGIDTDPELAQRLGALETADLSAIDHAQLALLRALAAKRVEPTLAEAVRSMEEVVGANTEATDLRALWWRTIAPTITERGPAKRPASTDFVPRT
jgi:hypothetical protein